MNMVDFANQLLKAQFDDQSRAGESFGDFNDRMDRAYVNELAAKTARRNETIQKAIDGWNKFRPNGVEKEAGK